MSAQGDLMAAGRASETHALQPWHTTALAIAECHRVEILLALRAEEKAGHPFTSWPSNIRAAFETEARTWLQANPARVLRAVTTAVIDDCGGKSVVMILHHAEAPPCADGSCATPPAKPADDGEV